MGFKKGESGNPKGRPTGAKGKVQNSIKEWIQTVVDGNREQFEQDLTDMEPNERVRVITNLLSFVTPKLQSMSVEELVNREYDRLSKFLDEAPDHVVEELAKKIVELKDRKERL